MPDSRRLPLSHEDEAALRDRQIDALLDEGLERFFAARYDEAIHLWTRVLFLDRSHARARAYIDRARTTLAEGQRRSDELLQASRELLEQGEADEARRLLTEAVAASGDEVQAAALRARLERLERVRALVVSAATEAPDVPAPVEPWSRWWSPRVIGVGAALVLVLGAAAIYLLSGGVPEADRVLVVTPVTAPAPLPVLTSSEVALVRARNAKARGRLSEALRELNRVGPDSPARPAADQFRIEIQQLLLASARSASATTPTESKR